MALWLAHQRAAIPLAHGQHHSSPPPPPWGHPDLVLSDAVTHGVITVAEAHLIAATRLEHTPVRVLAAEQGLRHTTVLKRRQRAEQRLAHALRTGQRESIDTASDPTSAAVLNRPHHTPNPHHPRNPGRSHGPSHHHRRTSPDPVARARPGERGPETARPPARPAAHRETSHRQINGRRSIRRGPADGTDSGDSGTGVCGGVEALGARRGEPVTMLGGRCRTRLATRPSYPCRNSCARTRTTPGHLAACPAHCASMSCPAAIDPPRRTGTWMDRPTRPPAVLTGWRRVLAIVVLSVAGLAVLAALAVLTEPAHTTTASPTGAGAGGWSGGAVPMSDALPDGSAVEPVSGQRVVLAAVGRHLGEVPAPAQTVAGRPVPASVLAQGGAGPSLDSVLTNVRNWIMGLLALLATVYLTVGGVRYVMSAGDPGEVEAAKRAFRSAAAGYALAALAPVLVQILRGIVGL